jgi:hypothetical protein
MKRRGRKPLATRHVDRLDGSELAKLRLETILDTMRGEITIPAACQRLGVGEARFHALRQQWLQEALQLLEPRRVGRPLKEEQTSPREQELISENARLASEVQVAQTKREVAEIMAVSDVGNASKKKMRAQRARQLRAAQRRPR